MIFVRIEGMGSDFWIRKNSELRVKHIRAGGGGCGSRYRARIREKYW
jgi:hypothetical protein